MLFYIGYGMQLMGFILTGMCLVSGLLQGDYGKKELFEFILGMLFFYVGNFLRKWRRS